MLNLKDLTLGRRIQALRKQQGMTQEALAEHMGVSAQAVSKWENDQSCPDIMALPRLAQALGTSVDALLTGESSAASPIPASRKPEELIVRMAFADADGSRLGLNLPFTVFRLLVRHGMISVSFHGENGEFDVNEQAKLLRNRDFSTMVQMIETGVSGKLLDLEDDGEKLTIWTE
ncbi:MAG: helix-turn-helix transcriptional regulator [Clostridia bacterium]|nr:helix-turn-helix transcriptional regulator [Clostridia bacterium]